MPYPILFSAIETVVVFLHPFGDGSAGVYPSVESGKDSK